MMMIINILLGLKCYAIVRLPHMVRYVMLMLFVRVLMKKESID